MEDVEKYLGSGMVRAFGERVFDVIVSEPERLREVTSFGNVRAKRITDAWAEQKVVCEIMVFLHNHGVGSTRNGFSENVSNCPPAGGGQGRHVVSTLAGSGVTVKAGRGMKPGE